MKKAIGLTVFLAFVLILCASCGISTYDTYKDADKYSVGGVSYDGETIKKIDVDWISASVNIIVSDSVDGYSLHESGTLDKDKSVHSFIDEGVLYIKFCASGYNGIFSSEDIKSKALIVTVPDGIDISVNTVSADVKMENKKLKTSLGKIEIYTTSGDISVPDISCTTARIESVSGRIKAEQTECGTFSAKSVSGNIDLSCGANRISAETVSGDVGFSGRAGSLIVETISGDVDFSGAADTFSAKTTSGDVTVELDDISATVTFSTTSGRVDTDLDFSKRDERFIFGDGKCQISVRTVSGDLEIK